MLKRLMIITLLIVAFIMSPEFIQSAIAQPPPPPPPVAIPIDGGLGLLIAAGIAYGAKKLRNNEEI
jgi:hypothetical protein